VLKAAASRSVRLRQHERDLVAGSMERVQRNAGERGSSSENYLHEMVARPTGGEI
jgi:hypothetical protein